LENIVDKQITCEGCYYVARRGGEKDIVPLRLQCQKVKAYRRSFISGVGWLLQGLSGDQESKERPWRKRKKILEDCDEADWGGMREKNFRKKGGIHSKSGSEGRQLD